MKNSELRKLIVEYKKIELKSKKLKDKKFQEKLGQIEHRYYHETGRMLKSDLEEIT